MRNRFHFTRQGKWHAQNIAALLLAGVMSMAPAGMAFAESEADDGPQTEAEAVDTTYAGYLGAAVDAAAIMESRAMKEQIVLTEDEEEWDFGTIESSDPKMALIYFPSQKQREKLASVFDASGTGIVKPVSDEINSRYSENYAKLAEGLYQEGEYDPAVEEGAEEIPMVVVLLFYDRHMTMTVFEDGKYASEFLLSDETVIPAVDEYYLPKELALLGVTGECDQIIYEESQLDAVFEAADD